MEKKITYLPGTYGRSIHFLEALDYYNGLNQTREDSIRNNVLFEAYKNGDEKMANKATPVPISEMRSYERDYEWEKLTLSEKQVRARAALPPKGRRYEREVEQLSIWQGDLGHVFMLDMVGVYRNLPTEGKVFYDVTAKKTLIGEYTSYTMMNHCPRIFIYQVLQGFVPTRRFIYELLKRPLEFPIVYTTSLHFSRGLKAEDYPKILVQATKAGHSGTCLHMIRCGTLPNYSQRSEIASLCVQIACDDAIESDEERVTMKPFRHVRAALSDVVEALGDKDEAYRIRTFRVMTEEEIATQAAKKEEAERLKREKESAQEDLLDIEDFEN